nr:VPLPA-CTERM-specific exosortase XrtD [uncultured Desulfobacter sp.]
MFQKMMIRWDSGDNSYCYLVVPIFLYLCWEKKEAFRFGLFSWSAWGILPAIGSILLLAAGELGSVETLLYTGIWGCVVSTIIMLYGWRRSWQLWFPLLILAFIVPLPPFVNQILTFKMKMTASTLSVEMLRALGVSVLQNGNIIDLGITKLQVVDACSGLRYIMSMFLMSLLIGHFFVTGWWRRVLLLVFVYPLSIAINAVRIFGTGLLTLNGYTFLTEGPFHDGAGLVAFLIAGALLLFFAKSLMKIGSVKQAGQTTDQFSDSGAAPAGISKVIVLSLGLSLLFAGSGFALQNLGSVLRIPERPGFDSFPMEINGWQGKRQYLSKEILDSLWADDYVDAVFNRPGSGNTIMLLVPYYEYQGTRHTAHAPQSCLLGSGWDMTRSGMTGVDVGERNINIGMMHLQKDNMHMLASYFFLQRGRVIVSPWMNKFYLLLDAVKRRRTDGALVRVEMLVPENTDIKTAEAQLKDFIRDLWPLLKKYVPE